MTISFKCEHCGKKVEAPDTAGGRRGKCPYCKQTCYIPGRVADEELYDFAPEDEAEEQRARQEQQALRRQERELLAEAPQKEVVPPTPFEQREGLESDDLHHVIVNYCLDLRDSNLERAEAHVAQLRKVRRTALVAVEDFLSGKALEPALDAIPTKLLQGFLTQLRDALSE